MEGGGVKPTGCAVLCHREPLLGAAAAASLESGERAWVTIVVGSVAELLARLTPRIDVAVVFDGFGDEIADLCEAMHHRGSHAPVLVVSSDPDPERAAGVVEAGGAGVLSADCDPGDLDAAMRAVRAGRVVIPADRRVEVLDALRRRREWRDAARRTLALLSPLDLRILDSLCDGMPVTRIAERLLLSPHTVRGRVRSIGERLGVRGQLGIAVAGRDLLAAARLPAAALSPTMGTELRYA